uniref:ZM domain-containing protein n=2 Tax=Caenorhabditis tropicalis TaxID=1561998 RepID=A0A1I7U9W3_9PELO
MERRRHLWLNRKRDHLPINFLFPNEHLSFPNISFSQSSTSDEKSPSSEDLTLNSSIVTAIRQPIAATVSPTVINKPVEEKPTLAVKGMTKKETNQPSERTNQPAIGVVSPIMAHKKIPNDSTSPEKPDTLPEKLQSVDMPPPPVPLKSFERVPPKMAPLRQPPTYDLLLKQGKITSPVKSFGYEQVDSSASEDSIVAHAAQVQMALPVQKNSGNHSSLERRMQKNKTSESSGYASDAGVAMCAKMREKLKEYDDMTRRAQNGYPDKDRS